MNIQYLYTKDGDLFGELKFFEEIYTDYKLHSHTKLCLGIVEEGSVEIQYEDTKKIVSNSIIVFNPNQLHKMTNIDAKNYYVLFLSNYTNTMIDHIVDFSKELNDTFLISCKTQDIEELQNIIHKLFNTYTIQTNFSTNKFVQDIEKYINENDKLTTSELASLLGYDKSYFIRVFKKNFGITPHDYIINERIDTIKNQLLTSENSLSELSQDLGFYDQSHLNKNFKKIFAVSPGKYLK